MAACLSQVPERDHRHLELVGRGLPAVISSNPMKLRVAKNADALYLRFDGVRTARNRVSPPPIWLPNKSRTTTFRIPGRRASPR